MKLRKTKKEDIKRIDELYVDGSVREGKLQFPKITIKEMKKDLAKYKTSRPKCFLKDMKSKNNYWLVAEENSEIFGFGQARIQNKETGRIEKIYVDKKHAGKGIGLKILKTLEKWLKAKKVKFIESGIYYKNKPSIKLHEKAGYKPISIKMRKRI
ncbi:GNAT family N-acetyltransferase [Candidatus Woesearchaeota archaeon]|nr:GNAT family N-acetyltransferase [Candidatus Woesearchaeota archaeon]MBW3005665.1 GNAT family N-acetyltransferase [Candidatus Woesearchaeota archaeon]